MQKPNLNVKNIRLTTHAHERIEERFKIKDKTSALNHVKSLLGRAKYIGEIVGEDGNRSHMYTADKIAIHINLDLTAILTVYPIDSHGQYFGLKEKVKNLYEKEFRKVDRIERSMLRRMEHLKLKTEAEISALKYRKYKTRSKNVKEECEKMIANLNNQVNDLDLKIKNIQNNKREIARAYATVVL
ncbi:hypothetical protein [Paenibacillus naphthalenovorans]|uniref:Uncharacterized protein n=1 Tax=Paenibacillus naphthalenovorans TaxID=162209 RepID=A0A0U2U6V8_9BACL|nr:hypothetical protein [Paenibacillus naphthalenovorans]ALS22105.1 hypothetical protein IJ22_17310 [Paenibacillus naphthalenovorans]